MKLLNYTSALCFAALLFAAGCNYKVEVGGEDSQAAGNGSEQPTSAGSAAAQPTIFDIGCHIVSEEEHINLCATYIKNEGNDGYTILIEGLVDRPSGFVIASQTINSEKQRVIKITYTPTSDQTEQTPFFEKVTISQEQVNQDKEVGISVELHDANSSSKPGIDDLIRKVVLTRGHGINNEKTAAAN